MTVLTIVEVDDPVLREGAALVVPDELRTAETQRLIEVEGLTAGTFQHEVDHLDGILFLDRVKDPRTFSTWTEFERRHQAAFRKRIRPHT